MTGSSISHVFDRMKSTFGVQRVRRSFVHYHRVRCPQKGASRMALSGAIPLVDATAWDLQCAISTVQRTLAPSFPSPRL